MRPLRRKACHAASPSGQDHAERDRAGCICPSHSLRQAARRPTASKSSAFAISHAVRSAPLAISNSTRIRQREDGVSRKFLLSIATSRVKKRLGQLTDATRDVDGFDINASIARELTWSRKCRGGDDAGRRIIQRNLSCIIRTKSMRQARPTLPANGVSFRLSQYCHAHEGHTVRIHGFCEPVSGMRCGCLCPDGTCPRPPLGYSSPCDRCPERGSKGNRERSGPDCPRNCERRAAHQQPLERLF